MSSASPSPRGPRLSGWLALGLAAATGGFAADERPAILAPPAAAPVPAGTTPEAGVPRAPISERLRAELSERVRAQAAALPAATERRVPEGDSAATDGGAVVMPRFLVKAVGPGEREVERRDALAGPLRRFERMEPIGRKVTGYEATLVRWAGGAAELRLNVINGAGSGIDHGRDFTRGEIALRLRF